MQRPCVAAPLALVLLAASVGGCAWHAKIGSSAESPSVAAGGAGVHDMAQARRMLARAREFQWSFPSSSGRPITRDAASAAIEQAARERSLFIDAARILVRDGEVAAATELAADAWRLWVLARDEAGGRAFLGFVLDQSKSPAASRNRALALYGDGLLAFRLGDLAASRDRNAAALQIARTAGDAEAEALALLGLSRVELSAGRYAAARELATASRALVRDRAPALGQAPLHMLAQATRLTGDDAQAAELFRESLALNRRLGDQGMVVIEFHNLGHVELRLGRVDAAERSFAECAALSAGDADAYGDAMALFNRAAVAFARGEHAAAKALLGQARSLLAGAGIDLAADDAVEFNRLERQLETAPAP